MTIVMNTPDKRKALGRGLESLLPSPRSASAAQRGENLEDVREIAVDYIDRNPYQTRLHVDEQAMDELAKSISQSGVIQPIVVRQAGDRYQLIAGERRWMASKRAGRSTIPAIVRPVSNQQAMEMTIIENLQREDLNPMDQARAYDRLATEFKLSQAEMAERTGKERATVANFVRLLRLPGEVQQMVQANEISFGHAKLLPALESPELITKIAMQIREKALSVRQSEEFLRSLLHTEQPKPPKERMIDPNVKEAERQLERSLGVKVRIDDRNGRGKIVIEYSSLEDFDRILEALQT